MTNYSGIDPDHSERAPPLALALNCLTPISSERRVEPSRSGKTAIVSETMTRSWNQRRDWAGRRGCRAKKHQKITQHITGREKSD